MFSSPSSCWTTLAIAVPVLALAINFVLDFTLWLFNRVPFRPVESSGHHAVELARELIARQAHRYHR